MAGSSENQTQVINNGKIFNSLVNEIRVNNAVIVIGAGVSFEPGMPLYSQLAPTVWEVVSSFPDIDEKFQGSGSTKNRIGENFEKLKMAFKYIESNKEALSQFKHIFKKINDKITVAPVIHKDIARLIHENFFELVVSFNWDSLLEMSWSELYGTHINASKKNITKPHGDVLELEKSWVLPNSPGRISDKEKDYINQLAEERPRTLIIVGYSENDAKIVEELITPFENRWKVYRVSPFSSNEDFIHLSAREFFERLVEKLIKPYVDNNWEYLNFHNQNKSVARAILGYKLTPQDVESCPELPQVQKAINILELNNFVIIQGKPGSGKSISCYQIAYYYLKRGYEVLRYKTENFTELIDLNMPLNPKAIYIIDDGQILPNSYLLKLQEKSSENQKIILTVTDDIEIDSAIISISNIENIELISKFYLENRGTVLDIVSSIDKDVGDYFMQESLEDRIKVAAKQENLWTFNYVLRGSWKTTKEDYYLSKELEDSQRFIFMLSLKQIITKDKVVDIKWIKHMASEHFSKDEEWVALAIKNLRKKRLIDSKNLRMIHYEAAKRQLIYIFENDKENRINYEEIIHNEILSNKNPILGKVWFMNTIFSSSIMRRITLIISSNDLYNIIYENLSLNEKITTEHTLYFIDVLTRATDKQFFDIYRFSEEIIKEVEKVSNTTAYSLSRVLNELYNSDRKKARDFANRIDLQKLAYRVSNLDKEYFYQWGKFISRLTLLLNKNSIIKFIKLIDKGKIESELSTLQNKKADFESLVEFIVTIFYCDKEYGIELFNLMSEKFRIAFNQNALETWHTLGFSFILYLMGFNSLSEKREYIKKDQKIISEKIISFINVDQLAEEVLSVPFREWHNLSQLFSVLRRIDFKKYSQLVESIDLECLKYKFDKGNVWEEFNSEIIEFLFIYLDKKYIHIVDNFIFENKDKIKEMNIFQFAFSPSLIEYFLVNDLYIPMYSSKFSKGQLNWQAFGIIIFILLDKNHNLLQKFLLSKSEEIANAISNFESIDLDGINECIEIVKNFDKDIIDKIKGHINFDLLKTRVQKACYSKYYSSKQLTEIKQKLILLFNQIELSFDEYLL